MTKIELFEDNCFTQNKNQYLLAFFHGLVHESRIKEVNIHYPLPRYSRMCCAPLVPVFDYKGAFNPMLRAPKGIATRVGLSG